MAEEVVTVVAVDHHNHHHHNHNHATGGGSVVSATSIPNDVHNSLICDIGGGGNDDDPGEEIAKTVKNLKTEQISESSISIEENPESENVVVVVECSINDDKTQDDPRSNSTTDYKVFNQEEKVKILDDKDQSLISLENDVGKIKIEENDDEQLMETITSANIVNQSIDSSFISIEDDHNPIDITKIKRDNESSIDLNVDDQSLVPSTSSLPPSLPNSSSEPQPISSSSSSPQNDESNRSTPPSTSSAIQITATGELNNDDQIVQDETIIDVKPVDVDDSTNHVAPSSNENHHCSQNVPNELMNDHPIEEIKQEEFEQDLNLDSKNYHMNRLEPIKDDHMMINVISARASSDLFALVNFAICENVKNFNQVKKILISHGAKFWNYLSDNVTYLVADDADHLDVSEALDIYEKPVVTSPWVWISLRANHMLPVEPFRIFPANDHQRTTSSKNNPKLYRLFSNVVACPSQLAKPDCKRLWSMITYYGGQFSIRLDSQVTHLVTNSISGSKYDTATAKQQSSKCVIKIVSPDWVVDSIKQQTLCMESRYDPRLLINYNQGVSIKPIKISSTTNKMPESFKKSKEIIDDDELLTGTKTTKSQVMMAISTEAVVTARKSTDPLMEQHQLHQNSSQSLQYKSIFKSSVPITISHQTQQQQQQQQPFSKSSTSSSSSLLASSSSIRHQSVTNNQQKPPQITNRTNLPISGMMSQASRPNQSGFQAKNSQQQQQNDAQQQFNVVGGQMMLKQQPQQQMMSSTFNTNNQASQGQTLHSPGSGLHHQQQQQPQYQQQQQQQPRHQIYVQQQQQPQQMFQQQYVRGQQVNRMPTPTAGSQQQPLGIGQQIRIQQPSNSPQQGMISPQQQQIFRQQQFQQQQIQRPKQQSPQQHYPQPPQQQTPLRQNMIPQQQQQQQQQQIYLKQQQQQQQMPRMAAVQQSQQFVNQQQQNFVNHHHHQQQQQQQEQMSPRIPNQRHSMLRIAVPQQPQQQQQSLQLQRLQQSSSPQQQSSPSMMMVSNQANYPSNSQQQHHHHQMIGNNKMVAVQQQQQQPRMIRPNSSMQVPQQYASMVPSSPQQISPQKQQQQISPDRIQPQQMMRPNEPHQQQAFIRQRWPQPSEYNQQQYGQQRMVPMRPIMMAGGQTTSSQQQPGQISAQQRPSFVQQQSQQQQQQWIRQQHRFQQMILPQQQQPTLINRTGSMGQMALNGNYDPTKVRATNLNSISQQQQQSQQQQLEHQSSSCLSSNESNTNNNTDSAILTVTPPPPPQQPPPPPQQQQMLLIHNQIQSLKTQQVSNTSSMMMPGTKTILVAQQQPPPTQPQQQPQQIPSNHFNSSSTSVPAGTVFVGTTTGGGGGASSGSGTGTSVVNEKTKTALANLLNNRLNQQQHHHQQQQHQQPQSPSNRQPQMIGGGGGVGGGENSTVVVVGPQPQQPTLNIATNPMTGQQHQAGLVAAASSNDPNGIPVQQHYPMASQTTKTPPAPNLVQQQPQYPLQGSNPNAGVGYSHGVTMHRTNLYHSQQARFSQSPVAAGQQHHLSSSSSSSSPHFPQQQQSQHPSSQAPQPSQIVKSPYPSNIIYPQLNLRPQMMQGQPNQLPPHSPYSLPLSAQLQQHFHPSQQPQPHLQHVHQQQQHHPSQVHPPGASFAAGTAAQYPPSHHHHHHHHPPTPNLIRFYGHEPRGFIPPDLCLLGCVFFIAPSYSEDSSLSDLIPGWRKRIQLFGGQIHEEQYENNTGAITHVLTENVNGPLIKQALHDKKRCVSVFWLDDVLSNQRMLPPWRFYHLPVAFDVGLAPCKNQIISITNFDKVERNMIQHLVARTGAKFTRYFSPKNTLLICKKLQGAKHEKAVQWRITVVNLTWLQDILFGHLDILNFANLPKKYQIFDQQQPPPASAGTSKTNDNQQQQQMLTPVQIMQRDTFRVDYGSYGAWMAAWRMPIKYDDAQLIKYQQRKQNSKIQDQQADNESEKFLPKNQSPKDDSTKEDVKPPDNESLTPILNGTLSNSDCLDSSSSSSSSLMSTTMSTTTNSNEVVKKNEENNHDGTKRSFDMMNKEDEIVQLMNGDLNDERDNEKTGHESSALKRFKSNELENEEKMSTDNDDDDGGKVKTKTDLVKSDDIGRLSSLVNGPSETIENGTSEKNDENSLPKTLTNTNDSIEKQNIGMNGENSLANLTIGRIDGLMNGEKSEEINKGETLFLHEEINGASDSTTSSNSNTSETNLFKVPYDVRMNMSVLLIGPGCILLKDYDRFRSIVESLGAQLSVDKSKATHLVVCLKSTSNGSLLPKVPVSFFCAFSRVQYLLRSEWLIDSSKAGRWLSETQYYYHDEILERSYRFNLFDSFKRRSRTLFNNWIFLLTRSVPPSPFLLKQIIEANGGQAEIRHFPNKRQLNMLRQKKVQFSVITCDTDLHLCEFFSDFSSIEILSPNFIYHAILKQKIELEPFRIGRKLSLSSRSIPSSASALLPPPTASSSSSLSSLSIVSQQPAPPQPASQKIST